MCVANLRLLAAHPPDVAQRAPDSTFRENLM